MKKIPVDAPEAESNAVRQDTRKHTKHVLRPTKEIVEAFQSGDLSWDGFESEYRSLLDTRFSEDRKPFEHLADMAGEHDVFLGCSCPTRSNPNVNHCHTVLALRFMAEIYPSLEISIPETECEHK